MFGKFFRYMRVRRERMENREERLFRQLFAASPDKYPLPSWKPFALVWLFMLIFPLMFARPAEPGQTVSLWDLMQFYIPLVITGIVFSLNQYILVARYFVRKKYKRYFFWNAAIILFCLFCREAIYYVMEGESSHGIVYFFTTYCFSSSRYHSMSILGVILFVVVVYIVCAMCVLFNMSMRRTMLAFVNRDREHTKLQYELDFLKNQLSPHFLFNTLNNISALISLDPSKAEKSMAKLSQLLRVMLYQTGDEKISIKEDVEILEKYADLEKLRLDPSFDFRMDVEIEDENRKIEPLLCMPIMENALKHCINPKGGSFAHIKIQQHGRQLIFESENSNFPRKAKPKAGGLGLATFKKRLDMLYMDRYEYTTDIEGEVYRCSLKIQLGES